MSIQLFSLLILAILSARIITEDLRKMEIPASTVLVLTVFAILTGVLFPLTGLKPDHALWGSALGLAAGTATRGYIHWRTGARAFGGADIALISAAGGLLGPFLFGPWLVIASITGILLFLITSRFTRQLDIDGTPVTALPFCPALILSASATYGFAMTGYLPAIFP
jgi:prepilin signal peptidase PulO-like enzyme (type II secretory pathway)